LAAALGLKLAA